MWNGVSENVGLHVHEKLLEQEIIRPRLKITYLPV